MHLTVFAGTVFFSWFIVRGAATNEIQVITITHWYQIPKPAKTRLPIECARDVIVCRKSQPGGDNRQVVCLSWKEYSSSENSLYTFDIWISCSGWTCLLLAIRSFSFPSTFHYAVSMQRSKCFTLTLEWSRKYLGHGK